MAAEMLTRDDLATFKTELFFEFRNILKSASTQPRKWLRSFEVRDLLGISTGTLQHMRVNGTLSYTRIGGILFYDYDDIIKLMEGSRKNIKGS
ncbi:helix-turn-helix domain-containing protein [Chitinophaga sp. MM2321]|uniref:helix-turn-helix domain-containing protein n=1 Tax=Chitinophaga sp. MM2321 TaxID=3137178 RepID=UPI0032D5A89B